MSPAALMGRSGTLKGRSIKAKKRVAPTQLFHLCACAQLQMSEAMREVRKARKFAYTIAQERETELQRFKRYIERLKEELEQKDAELQRAKKHNSCLAADIKGLKAELEKEEAEHTQMSVCHCEPYSEVEGFENSEDRI